MTPPPVDEPGSITQAQGTGGGLNLFGGLKGRGADNTLDLPTAMMIPMVAAMVADSRLEDEELAHIEGICAFSPIFDRNSAIENGALIMRVVKLIEDHGIPAMCLRAASLLSPALRETAFVFAVRVVFSDGYVGKMEREVVEKMIEWLQLDPSRARTMIEVVSIMHHSITA